MNHPKSSKDIPGQPPRQDKEGDHRRAVIEDADKDGGEHRDLEHGDGGSLDMPTKP